MSVSQQTTAEMDRCRVVGLRGLCRPLDERQRFPTNNPPLTPCEVVRSVNTYPARKAPPKKAFKDRPSRPSGRLLRVGEPKISKEGINGHGFGPSLLPDGRKVISLQSSSTERLYPPSPF